MALLTMRGTRPAGPPPAATAARHVDELPAGAVIELERAVDTSGTTRLGKYRVKTGSALAGQRVLLRLDGHLLHAGPRRRGVGIVPEDIVADSRV